MPYSRPRSTKRTSLKKNRIEKAPDFEDQEAGAESQLANGCVIFPNRLPTVRR